MELIVETTPPLSQSVSATVRKPWSTSDKADIMTVSKALKDDSSNNDFECHVLKNTATVKKNVVTESTL